MKLSFLTLFLIFILTTGNAIGWGSWRCETVNGSIIRHPGGSIYLESERNGNRINLSGLKKWYFYKDHIVGIYLVKDNSSWVENYFVLNELNLILSTFTEIQEFNKYLSTTNLVPEIETKWFSQYWKPLNEDLMMLLVYPLFIFGFPFVLLVLLISECSTKGFRTAFSSLKRPFLLSLLFCIVYFLRYMYLYYLGVDVQSF